MRDPHIDKLLQDLKTKKFRDGEAKGLVETIGDEIKKQLTPAFEGLAKELKSEMVGAFKDAVNSIKVDVPPSEAPQVNVTVPEIQIPEFNIPTPQVTVNVPKADTPVVNVSPAEVNFPDEMRLAGIGPKTPLHVMMMDQAGKPIIFSQPSGATGGRGDFFTIKDIQNSTGGSIIDTNTGYVNVRLPEGLTVAGSNNSTQGIDSSGDPYSQANPFPVTLVSGTISSTKAQIGNSDGDFSQANPLPVVFSSSGSTASALIDSSGAQYSGSNPLPVVFSSSASTASALVDSSGVQYSGSNPLPIAGTVAVSGVTGTIASANVDSSGVQYSGSNPFPFTLVTNASATMNVALTDSSGVQYSGSNPLPIVGPVVVTSVTNTIASANVDSTGAQYSGSNPFPITIVTSATATVNSRLVDSSGIGYDGSNALPVRYVAGASGSTIVNISDSSGVGYSGSNPVPITIVSGASSTMNAVLTRQTNPAAVAADYVPLAADDLGRQLVRPIQVRDLIKTAYVALSTGTETTLLAAVAGAFLDCIALTATNNSTAATQLDIRATTGGNIVHTMYLPASSGPIGWSLAVPWPQDNQGNNWTIDMPDQTGTTVYVSALFSQEV